MAENEIASRPLDPEGRPCTTPSAPRLFDLFENIPRHHLAEKGKVTRAFLTEPSPLPVSVVKRRDISPDLSGQHRR